MGFLSILKRVGSVLKAGGAIGAEIAGLPFVANILSASKAGFVTGKVLGELDDLAGIIATVETIGQIQGSTGAEKLALAAPLVETALIQWASSSMPGHELKDKTKAAAAARQITSSLADFMNSWG